MEITAPNQVWVADITYIRTVKGFCYLALITDLFSRKIVGYDISDTLELTGCLGAFKRAQKAARPAAGLVHHSDRGVQYCSNQYVNELKKHQIKISMTEENHCYENAVAERVQRHSKRRVLPRSVFLQLLKRQRLQQKVLLSYITIKDFIYL